MTDQPSDPPNDRQIHKKVTFAIIKRNVLRPFLCEEIELDRQIDGWIDKMDTTIYR